MTSLRRRRGRRGLINVSVLGEVASGLTAGFVIAGDGNKTVLIRAVGPTLGAPPFALPGMVADPRLALYPGNGLIASNDGWEINTGGARSAPRFGKPLAECA